MNNEFMITRPRQNGKTFIACMDESKFFSRPLVIGGGLRSIMSLLRTSQAIGLVGKDEGNLDALIEEENSYMSRLLHEYRMTINLDHLALKPLALALSGAGVIELSPKPLVKTKTIKDWLPPSLTELGNAKQRIASEDWYKSDKQRQEQMIEWRQFKK